MSISILPKTPVKADKVPGKFFHHPKTRLKKKPHQSSKKAKKAKPFPGDLPSGSTNFYVNSKKSFNQGQLTRNSSTHQLSPIKSQVKSQIGGHARSLIQKISSHLSDHLTDQVSSLSNQIAHLPASDWSNSVQSNNHNQNQFQSNQQKIVKNNSESGFQPNRQVLNFQNSNSGLELNPHSDNLEMRSVNFNPNNPNFPNLNYTSSKSANFNYPAAFDAKKSLRDAKSTTISRQFALRHTYRAGAIVWVKYRGENYYVVFRSLSRPSRGVQIPGGRIERMENVAEAVTREVYEEIGVQTRILCPLGFLFTENLSDNFSRIEIYYIVRPIFPIDVFRHWQHTDLDEKRQAIEKQQVLDCWCVPCERDISFLSYEQGQAVVMFRQWLGQHKKPKDHYGFER